MKRIVIEIALLYCCVCEAQFYVVDNKGEVVFQMTDELPAYISFEEPVIEKENVQAIDLGLTSGILWAEYNIGAKQSFEFGDYYAWGMPSKNYIKVDGQNEIVWKDGLAGYDWISYSHSIENGHLKKYVLNEHADIYGVKNKADNKKMIEKSDDAANIQWGEGWFIPSKENFQELFNECDWEWTDNYQESKVCGYIVKSKKEGNDNFIFLPASGYRDNTDLFDVNSFGYYWTKSLDEKQSDFATYLFFYNDYIGPWHNGYRYRGFAIRPVCKVVESNL